MYLENDIMTYNLERREYLNYESFLVHIAHVLKHQWCAIIYCDSTV